MVWNIPSGSLKNRDIFKFMKAKKQNQYIKFISYETYEYPELRNTKFLVQNFKIVSK